MTQEEMNRLVPQRLERLEREEGVRVLHAVESGSRAWGFASPDSDFDVRFLYVRSAPRYLTIDKQRDVIELPIDDTWDVNGWDLKKALALLYRCNPTLYEWMNSPIVYQTSETARQLRPLLQAYYSRKRMLYHYIHAAASTYRSFLLGDRVMPKKYFYALRPILACQWLLHRDTPPPVPFDTLAEAELPAPLWPSVRALLDMKAKGPERLMVPPIPDLQRYLAQSVEDVGAAVKALPAPPALSSAPLNRFFVQTLGLADETA